MPIRRLSIASTMFSLLNISLLLAFQTATTCFAQAPLPQGFEAVGKGTLAPKTKFLDEKNFPTSIDAFRGKIVVLNLWATWCAPCIREMPSLERLSSHMPADQFAFVAVSQDKGGIAVVRPFLDRLGIRGLSIYTDPVGRLPREFGGRGMPTTFIIGKSGDVISRLEGSADWDAKEIVSYLASLAD